MNNDLSDLRIRVHQLDRSISTFVQDDPDMARQALAAFDPSGLFKQPQIIFANSNSHTAIPVSQITRIDFESEQETQLLFPEGVVEAVELTKDECEGLIQNLTDHDQWQHLGELDAFVVTLLDVRMADRQSVWLTMEVEAESPQGLSGLREYLLGRPGFCFRMHSGGLAVLNIANLSSITFYPGTHHPPPGAWPFRHWETTSASRREVPEGPVPEMPLRGVRGANILRIKR